MTGLVRYYGCKKCGAQFIVPSIDPDIGLLKTRMRCPSSCGGTVRLRAETNIRMKQPVQQVTALHLYQAVMGVGLPQERRCGPGDVTKVLVGSRIKAIDIVEAPDPRRSIVNSITLEDGRVVYLASSTKGATVYRITEEIHGR